MKQKKEEAKKYCRICKRRIRKFQKTSERDISTDPLLKFHHESCYIDYWMNPVEENSPQKRFANFVGVEL